MNKIVTHIGAFFAGLAVGGAAGYFVTKSITERKCSKLNEEEIASARKHYEDKLQEELTKINDAAREKIEKVISYDKPDLASINPDYLDKAEDAAETGDYIDESGVPDYSELKRINPDCPYEPPTEKPRSGKYPWGNPAKLNGRAGFITMDEFLDTDNDYDKNYFTLYADGVVADDMDVVMEPNRFGATIEQILKQKEKVDGADMYMRNKELENDFEIHCDYRDYYTAVGRHPY